VNIMNHLFQIKDSSNSAMDEIMRIQSELMELEISILKNIETLIGTKAFVSFYYLDRVGLDKKLKR
jgi:hypothetical protein